MIAPRMLSSTKDTDLVIFIIKNTGQTKASSFQTSKLSKNASLQSYDTSLILQQKSMKFFLINFVYDNLMTRRP